MDLKRKDDRQIYKVRYLYSDVFTTQVVSKGTMG